MRLPRNAKIFRGQLDVAPFAAVFFLLVIFLALSSKFVFHPGVRINLPDIGQPAPGTANRTVVVAIDAEGQLYFDGQDIAEADLLERLKQTTERARQPLTLVLQADRQSRLEVGLRVAEKARPLGFLEIVFGTLPRHVELRETPAP